MTNLEIIIFVAERAVFTLILAALMSMFFGKRKTRIGVILASYLLFAALAPDVFWWLNVPPLSAPGAVAAIFLVTLNYEATMRKRALVTLAALFVLVIGKAAAAFVPFWLGFGISSIASFVVIAAVALIVVAITIFKNRRK